jgi:hypothetical protein
MRQWAKATGVEFALDPSKPVPTDLELKKRPVDDTSPAPKDEIHKAYKDRSDLGMKFMLYNERDPLAKKANTLKEWFARPSILWTPPKEE